MLKPRIYMCFSKMMKLQNKWSSVLWLEALCYLKIVVFGISYYVFFCQVISIYKFIGLHVAMHY
jgi:hypothetical protein